ncbi:MAG: hypothetical protein ACPG4T_14020, partial [Nannocystaceae bacterium]
STLPGKIAEDLALPGDTVDGRVVAARHSDMSILWADELHKLPVVDGDTPEVDGKRVHFRPGQWFLRDGKPCEVLRSGVDGTLYWLDKRPIRWFAARPEGPELYHRIDKNGLHSFREEPAAGALVYGRDVTYVDGEYINLHAVTAEQQGSVAICDQDESPPRDGHCWAFLPPSAFVQESWEPTADDVTERFPGGSVTLPLPPKGTQEYAEAKGSLAFQKALGNGASIEDAVCAATAAANAAEDDAASGGWRDAVAQGMMQGALDAVAPDSLAVRAGVPLAVAWVAHMLGAPRVAQQAMGAVRGQAADVVRAVTASTTRNLQALGTAELRELPEGGKVGHE